MPDASRPDARPLAAAELFPVTHSLLSPDALGRFVQAVYAIGEVRACILLQHNLNDTYVVEATTGRYVLRASQAARDTGYSWRTREDILFELDVLQHLSRAGVPVAAPLAQRDGTYVSAVQAPEGVRYLVLSTYAPGEPVTPPQQTAPLARGYGGAVAALHAATDDFSSAHPRFALDLDFLFAKPLDVVHPYVAHRPDDWRFLRALGEKVTERLGRLQTRGLDSGVCHGDAQTVDQLCTAYVSGYLERRPLSPADHEAIAPCVLLREFWYLGMVTGNWENWGIDEAQREAFFDQEVTFMREWAAEHQLLS